MFAGMPRAWCLTLTFLVVSAGLASLAPEAEAATVTPDATKLDDPLVGASAAYVGGRTIIFGGRLADGSYSSKVYAYDAASRVVAPIGELPKATTDVDVSAGRYSGTAVAVGNKVYYFGGAQLQRTDINGDGQPEQIPKASSDVILYDGDTGEVRMLRDKLPQGTWGMAGASASGYVYLFGGFSFDIANLPGTARHDRILKFDPSASEPLPGATGSAARARFTKVLSPLPYTVQDAAAATLGRRIALFGGLADHDNDTNPCPTYTFYNAQTGQQDTRQITTCLTKRIVTFDPSNDLVVGIAGELPYRAQFIHAAVVGGKAYIPGALLSDGTASSSILEIALDRANVPQVKVLTPTLPRGSFGQGVATDGETITIIGGRWGTDRELTDEIVRLDPRPTPPWAPRSALATEIVGGVRLTWEPPTYNGDAAITGYRVYRSGGDAANETRLTETTTLLYEDKTVRPGAEYTWRVVAVNAVGEGNQSARVSRSSAVVVPGSVASFQAFPGNGEVLLRWRAPEESGGSNITGYRILKDGALLTSLPPDKSEHVDRAVQNGEPHAYQVRAYNAKGDGALSDRQVVTPAAVPPAPGGVQAEVVTAGDVPHVKLSWVDAAGTVERYLVHRATRPGTLGTLLTNVTQTSYTDDHVTRGLTYYYSIQSWNEAGPSPPSPEASVSLVRKPGAPTGLVAVGLDGQITLAWNAPSDAGDAPPSSLRYYVSRTGGGSARSSIVKTEIEGTTFVDRLVTPGQAYTYTVTTLNPMPSDASEPATATARIVQNKAPVAVLAALPPLAAAGDPVELDASNSADLDGTIKSYLYDFGDGTEAQSSSEPTVTHAYHANGTYIATVIVTDDRGLVSSPASAQVIVGETISDKIETGLGGAKPAPGSNVPGSAAPKLPGPGPALLFAALGMAALAFRRRAM